MMYRGGETKQKYHMFIVSTTVGDIRVQNPQILTQKKLLFSGMVAGAAQRGGRCTSLKLHR